MAQFNIYEDVLVPIKFRLDADPRFGGRGIKVFYDRTREREVEPSIMPAINYFLEAPWNDQSIGVGAYSVQLRKYTVRVGVALWCANGGDQDLLDEDLHRVGADLLDFFREREYWDPHKQIALAQEITQDFDHAQVDGIFVGTQKLSLLFDMYAR